MVHKYYVKRNGKKFGPYYYRSYRDGDKVKKEYLGTKLKELSDETPLLFFMVFLAAFLIFSFLYFTPQSKSQITGKAIDKITAAAADWPMFHHDLNRAGYVSIVGPSISSVLWDYTTKDIISSSPAVANGVVYVGSYDKNVYALDASTGNKIWSFATGDSIESSPAVANGIVYIGSIDSKLYALDALTGSKLWSFATGSLITYSSPAVANGIVYIGSWDDSIYALDALTGNKIWNYTTGDSIRSSPAVANGVVYIGSDDYAVYALDASTGSKIWSFTTGGTVKSSPAVADGVVYIGSYDSNVYALDALTGKKIWNYTIGGLITYSSPAVADGIVYVGSWDDSIYALDASTGNKIWSFATKGDIVSSPAVANGVVYVGSYDKNVYALDALTGNKIWNYTTGDSIRSSPAVANGVVYIGSDDDKIYAFGEKCVDECAKEERKCEGNAYVICGNYDVDECLEWSDLIECAFGYYCYEGKCVKKEELCIPEWVCTDWSECKATYGLEAEVKGKQYRTCVDAAGCEPSKIESRECVLKKIEIETKAYTAEKKGIVDIYEISTGFLIAKVEEGEREEKPYLDIDLKAPIEEVAEEVPAPKLTLSLLIVSSIIYIRWFVLVLLTAALIFYLVSYLKYSRYPRKFKKS